MPIKIVITDDHMLVLEGLQLSLGWHDSKIEIAATYTSGEFLLSGLKTTHPDILLLDLQLPGISGSDLVRHIKTNWPKIQIIILTGLDDSYQARELLKQGCKGYILKSLTNIQTLVHAIEQVYNGEIYLSPSLKDELLNDMLNIGEPYADKAPKLTRRESEVLKFMAAGFSSQQIAKKLYLSIRTIDSHRLSLLQKLGVNNSLALIKKARDFGLMKP